MPTPSPRSICLGLALALLVSAPAMAQRPGPMLPGVLRVCVDPDNLPMSNQAGEGVENKLAELLASTWHSRLEYIYWAAPRGMMRMLNGRYCDVSLQAAGALRHGGRHPPLLPHQLRDRAAPHRGAPGHQPRRSRAQDPAVRGAPLRGRRREHPPAMALSRHGVVGNLVGFSTTYVGGMNRPEDIIKAVVSDSIDVAIVWGPIAGYYTRQLGADLVLRPIERDSVSGMLFAYSMGMATRRADRAFRDSLQAFIDTKGAEIRAILDQFGIPLLAIPADTGRAGPAGPAR
ncbi:MAG: hypothetical protein IPI38_17985 [Gemmatimonadetes bacterium]|nr:hypothetical protein [Gemmatimonadota bacterium]